MLPNVLLPLNVLPISVIRLTLSNYLAALLIFHFPSGPISSSNSPRIIHRAHNVFHLLRIISIADAHCGQQLTTRVLSQPNRSVALRQRLHSHLGVVVVDVDDGDPGGGLRGMSAVCDSNGKGVGAAPLVVDTSDETHLWGGKKGTDR